MIALKRASSQSYGSGLCDRLLNNWLGVNDDCWLNLVENLGLLNWILDLNLGLNSNLHVCFSKMVKDNFSELDTVNFVLVDKVELYAFCRSVKLGEIDQVPNLKAKLQLSESDLNPSPLKSVKNADPHGSRRSAWMISRTFKSNTFEVEMLGKFNHNPGSLVIGCVPFIPFLLPRA